MRSEAWSRNEENESMKQEWEGVSWDEGVEWEFEVVRHGTGVRERGMGKCGKTIVDC